MCQNCKQVKIIFEKVLKWKNEKSENYFQNDNRVKYQNRVDFIK